MDASTIGLIAFAAVLILLALRVPIAFALASVATIATFFIFAFRTGTFMPERAIRDGAGVAGAAGPASSRLKVADVQ